MAEAQTTFNQETQQYQSDQSVAQVDANECSSAQATVQADVADGSSFLSGDEATAQSDCSRTQAAAELVSSDATQLSQDQASLNQAEGTLNQAEGFSD